MTNLLIGYPHIPRAAQYTLSEDAAFTTPNESYPRIHQSTFLGPRSTWWATSINSTLAYIRYDLGTGNTAAANFLAIPRIDISADVATNFNITLRRSSLGGTDGVNYTDVVNHNAATVTANSFGQYSNDYFTTFAVTSAYRYWLIKFTSSAAMDFIINKVYFGTSFDMGYDPTYPLDFQLVVDKSSQFESNNGATWGVRADTPGYEFTLVWENITDAIVKDFSDKILRYAHTTPVMLFTTSDHNVLNGFRIMHCDILEHEISSLYNRGDYNRISVKFRQLPDMIGLSGF